MTRDEEDRLYGPRPELVGRPALHVHDVFRGSEQDATNAVALGHGTSVLVERGRDSFKGCGTLLSRHMRADGFSQEGACPPELLHREVGGTHVFVSHDALAILRGGRVWAVTGAGVEVLK